MKLERISKIKEIVSLSMRVDGWTPMSTIGVQLIKKGIDIKDDGFDKLKPFFESLREYFVIGIDEKSQLPLVKCCDMASEDSKSKCKTLM